MYKSELQVCLYIIICIRMCTYMCTIYNDCIRVNAHFSGQCAEGFTYNKASEVCKPCEFGYFKDVPGQGQCEECPDGQTTRTMGSVFCEGYHYMCFIDNIDV